MATPTTYDYTVPQYDLNALTGLVQKSSISTALDHISTVSTTVTFTFKDALSIADKSTLDLLVSGYVYTVPVDPTQNVAIQSAPPPAPFAAKTIGTKKLYKRVTGVQATVVSGSTDVLFTILYPWAKITGIEIIGGAVLDTISLAVLDSAAGNYSGTANATLNRFGFNVNVGKDYYINTSEFDADLYMNMQIKISYNTAAAKTIGINFILNEVK